MTIPGHTHEQSRPEVAAGPRRTEPISIQRPDENIEDIYDASDEEVHQLAANIGMFEIVEEEVFNGPVPEEAPMGDDPIFMFSQRQSREFRNHDEIQRRLQINEEENDINVSGTDPNIDPFLDEIPQPVIDNDIQVENLVPNDPLVEENPHPQNNEIGQSQSLQQIDHFLESNPPPQAEDMITNHQQSAEIGEVIEAPPRRVPAWLAAPAARRVTARTIRG